MTDDYPPSADIGSMDIELTTDDVLLQQLLDDAVRRIAQAYQERLQREAVGAWMAGYAALDVVRDLDVPPAHDPDGTFPPPTGARVYYPRRDPSGRPDYGAGKSITRFDLGELTPDIARKLRRSWGGVDG